MVSSLPSQACIPDILAESLANPSFFSDLETYLTWDTVKEGEKDYLEYWLNKPGVRTLVSPPKKLTVEWDETFSLRGFPTSKFLRILPPIPALLKRSAETQVQSAPSAPLATGIEFKLTQVITPSAPNSATLHNQRIPRRNPKQRNHRMLRASPVFAKCPESGSKEAPSAERTASAQIRFSKPMDQDAKLGGEKQEGGQDANGSPRATDSASETEGGGTTSKSSNITDFTLGQIK